MHTVSHACRGQPFTFSRPAFAWRFGAAADGDDGDGGDDDGEDDTRLLEIIFIIFIYFIFSAILIFLFLYFFRGLIIVCYDLISFE